MWENFFQIAGVIMAAAGVYFAYRQYELARNQSADGGSSGDARAESPGGQKTSARFEAASRNTLEQNLGLVGGVALGCFFFAVPLFGYTAGDSFRQYLLLFLSFAMLSVTAMASDFFDKPRHVSADDTGIVVYFHPAALRRQASVRFAWSDIDSVFSTGEGAKRQLFLRMDSRLGVGTTSQQMLRDTNINAFKLCDLYDVKPSEAALLSSISHYSDGKFPVRSDKD